MNKLRTLFCSSVPGLSVLLLLCFSALNAQTNFVKYARNPILPLGEAGEWDDSDACFATVLAGDSTLLLWYSADGIQGDQAWRVGHATSKDGITWDKDSNNPVLGYGASGSFDSQQVWGPNVLFNGDYYEMWYNGDFSGLKNIRIGYATSPDGINWTKHTDNPVLQKGSPGSWDGNSVVNPVVLRTDSLYQMWYTGNSGNDIYQTGYATSADGMNWTKHPDNPVLTPGEAGEWDAWGAVARSILFEDGQYYMWYHGRSQSGAFLNIEIGLATSTDGMNWTKYSGNPVLKRGGYFDFDRDNAWFPNVVKKGHRYCMWYSGRRTGLSEDRLGYAEDFSNAAHVEGIQVSPQTIIAGSGEVLFEAYVANPHNENLTVQARVVSEDGSVNDVMDLYNNDDDNDWYAIWEPPVAPHDYSVTVELKNISAGYVHNSGDWGLIAGLNAVQATHTFSQIADIDDDQNGEAQSLALGSDGTIFLANGTDGLRAYSYDGVSFTEIAHINDGGNAAGVAEAADGTIFLATGGNGLRAYSYDGSSFNGLAHVYDGGSATDIVLADDGTIFIANGDDGLRAYRFDGSSLTNVAHINDSGSASVVALGADGTVFLADNENALIAYSYDDAAFSRIADVTHGSYGHNDIAIAADGTIFVASSGGRLHAYTYEDSTLSLVAEVHTRDWARALSIADDGTIFLACRGSVVSPGNLYAYTFDGTSFRATAHLQGGLRTAPGSMRTANGTIFIANGEAGLSAYTYDMATMTSVPEAAVSLPERYALAQNYPNPFNPTTTISYQLSTNSDVTLKIYNTLGQQIRTLVDTRQTAGNQQSVWDGLDNYGRVVPSGLYFYRLQAGPFVETRKMLLVK